uniref:BTB domain-containing protein n=1 Tax=Timema shepardi TaxID=629360 RepID=A0A7R9B6V7_TIMSH|nr:unnamed protein product [Timema shepardi]
MLYFTFPGSLSEHSGLAQPVPSCIQSCPPIHVSGLWGDGDSHLGMYTVKWSWVSLEHHTKFRWDSLFNSEADSDVIFLVGLNSELFRFPGHRDVLAAANPVFRAMLQGTFANEDVITINDVDDRAFDKLLRYMYREDVLLQSVATALSTLQAANKYMCDGLVHTCIEYLDLHLDTTTVIDVYQVVNMYASNCTPSAPPLCDDHMLSSTSYGQHFTESNVQVDVDYYNALLHNCLQFIDVHAEKVFQQENIEDLDLKTLTQIAYRDTLGLKSEVTLFKALERWSDHECKRQRLKLSPENRRTVLGRKALYSVRYVLMSSEDFFSGPMQLLDEEDARFILALILNHANIPNSTHNLREMLPRLRSSRAKPEEKFIMLSQRSTTTDKTPGESTTQSNCTKNGNTMFSKRNARKECNKTQSKNSSTNKGGSELKKRSKCSCVAEYIFCVLSCLFD